MTETSRSEIKINVELDAQKIPHAISWQADGSGEKGKSCEAFMLSIWDGADKNTLRIDLWTKEMRMDEMTTYFFQTLMSTAETYERATNSKNVVNEMKQFCEQLSKKITAQMSAKGQ